MNEPIELGKRHPWVQRVRELRRGRRARDERGLFLAEGIHLAREALDSGADIELALASTAIEESPEGALVWSRLGEAGTPRRRTAPAVHASLQDARSPQPLLLIVRQREAVLGDVYGDGRTAPLIVVAHGVQDPGNLGAIVRTAEAAGASGMVVCGLAADLYHPRTVRATMGSIFRLPVVRADGVEVLAALSRAGLTRVGGDPAAERTCDRVDLRGPTALLLGGEGAGLPAELRRDADLLVRIPMAGGVESLSVSVAAAVLLFEAARQRRGGPPDLIRGG